MSWVVKLPFVTSDIMPQHEEKIIETFDKSIGLAAARRSYNVLYDDLEFNRVVKERFYNLIHDNFDNVENGTINDTYVYVQDNEIFYSYWHNHVRTSTINAVFYWNIPRHGGMFEFFEPNVNGNIKKVQPEIDTILIMPYWMYHRPTPQLSNQRRISVNLEFFCKSRPLYKKTSQYW
jgi:hypothetical protein